jgi:CDP-diacylglycerol--glycerol-3-phosphate 3-phosphatidyltransferase
MITCILAHKAGIRTDVGRIQQVDVSVPDPSGLDTESQADGRQTPWTVPNILTWIRIAAIPLVILAFYAPYHWADLAACVVFAAAGITDTLDGYLARKLGQITRLGAFLDPVADKLIVATALVLLVSTDPRVLVVLMAIVIIGREIAISALREWMAQLGQRRKVAVSLLGKYKTIFQVVGLSMMFYRSPLWGLDIYKIGVGLTVLAAVLTLVSMVSYLRAAWPDLRS